MERERESNLLLQIILPHEKKLVSSNEKKKKNSHILHVKKLVD